MNIPDWLERLHRDGSLSIAEAINISRSRDPRWKTLLAELRVPLETAREVVELCDRKTVSVLQALRMVDDRSARAKKAASFARKAERIAARHAEDKAAAEARKVTDLLQSLELKRIAKRKRSAAARPLKRRRKVSLVESVRRFEKTVKRSEADPVGHLKSSLKEWEQLLDSSPKMINRTDADALADLLKRAKRVAKDDQRVIIARGKAVIDKLKRLGLLPDKTWVRCISTPMGGQVRKR